MQFSPSSIPIVRAINTAPLVSMSGEVIAGAGLDRKTGLFHCIDALLQGCIPVTPPTEQDVRAALIFLYDDWLVDVALDPVGKAVAIMLAMTLIERTLLPERPAFFIAAALRGGGSEGRRFSLIFVKPWLASFGIISSGDRRSVAPTLKKRSLRQKYRIAFLAVLCSKRSRQPLYKFLRAIQSRRAATWRAGP
jgi:hypothetical protein